MTIAYVVAIGAFFTAASFAAEHLGSPESGLLPGFIVSLWVFHYTKELIGIDAYRKLNPRSRSYPVDTITAYEKTLELFYKTRSTDRRWIIVSANKESKSIEAHHQLGTRYETLGGVSARTVRAHESFLTVKGQIDGDDRKATIKLSFNGRFQGIPDYIIEEAIDDLLSQIDDSLGGYTEQGEEAAAAIQRPGPGLVALTVCAVTLIAMDAIAKIWA